MAAIPTPDQFRTARLSIKLGRRDLARKAGCMVYIIDRIEAGELVPGTVQCAVRDALTAAGAKF